MLGYLRGTLTDHQRLGLSGFRRGDNSVSCLASGITSSPRRNVASQEVLGDGMPVDPQFYAGLEHGGSSAVELDQLIDLCLAQLSGAAVAPSSRCEHIRS